MLLSYYVPNNKPLINGDETLVRSPTESGDCIRKALSEIDFKNLSGCMF